MSILRVITACALTLVLAFPAYAASSFPQNPIRIISPYAPGDSVDNTARVLADAMGKILGVPVVVQNIAGGGGVTGMKEAQKAPADGYTLVMCTAGSYINAPLIGDTGYELKDFEPLARLVLMPLAVAVAAESPLKNLKDLVETGQKKQLKFSTPGPNSVQRIVMTGFALDNKFVPMAHIGGDGGAGATTKALTGEVDFSFLAMPVFYPLTKGGKLRILGAGAEERTSYLPDVPTFKEQGYKSPEPLWFGILIRAGAPADVVAAIQAAIEKAAANPATQEGYRKFQMDPAYLNAADFKKLIDATYAERLQVLPEIGLIKKK